MFLPALEILVSKYLLSFPVDHDTMSFDSRTGIVTFELMTDDGPEKTQVTISDMKSRLSSILAA